MFSTVNEIFRIIELNLLDFTDVFLELFEYSQEKQLIFVEIDIAIVIKC